jgi:nucleotide-binding universal stress UspA family protein
MANKLVAVARAGYIHRAYFFKEVLENAGIDSIIVNQGIDGAQSGNEIELLVEEEDVPRALEIMDEANATYKIEEIEPREEGIPSVRSILVPVDFSQYSLNAAKYAIQVAHQKQAAITFIHAFYDAVSNPINYESFYSYPGDITETQHEIEQDALSKMDDFVSILNKYMNLEGISGIKPRRRVMAGSAEDVILSMIETDQYDLVIVGSKAVVPSDSWFGSFTTTLVEKSTIPIMTIPEEAVYNNSPFKRLLYATNFDKSDGVAIRTLLNIAAPLETEIHIVHIDLTRDNPFINFDLTHFKEKYIGDIDQVNIVCDLIINEDIIKGLEDYIREKKIDILAVTTHKRNVITSFLKPSITKELLFKIPIPLLIFHSIVI